MNYKLITFFPPFDRKDGKVTVIETFYDSLDAARLAEKKRRNASLSCFLRQEEEIFVPVKQYRMITTNS